MFSQGYLNSDTKADVAAKAKSFFLRTISILKIRSSDPTLLLDSRREHPWHPGNGARGPHSKKEPRASHRLKDS